MSRNRFGLRLLILAAASAVAACVERPPIIDEAMASQLSTETSMADVKQALGSPTKFYAYKDGQKVLTYLRSCRDEPADEKCADAPEGAHWQRCLINFDQSDHWAGTSCTWTTKP